MIDDLTEAAKIAGADDLSFAWCNENSVKIINGWVPVTFSDSNSEDEQKKEFLRKWMKIWSRLVKMGWRVE